MKITHLALLVAIGVVVGGTAGANGLFENRPWQFDTPSDKVAKANILALIEAKKNGGLGSNGSGSGGGTSSFTTNIFGDQINCNLSSSALGNVGTNTMDAVTAAPTGVGDSDIFADATGNVASNTNTGNESDGGSVDNPQTNTSSPQTASADGSSILSSIGGDQTVTGTTDQVLNSDQQNFNSPVTSSVTGSTACHNP